MFKRVGWIVLVLSVGALLFAVGPAYADTTLQVSNPNDGFGSSYTFTATCDASNVCSVTLSINTATATQPYISAVDFKIGSKDSGATLTTPLNWTTLSTSLNNGGCDTNSGGDICSEANSTGSFLATGGTLIWNWTGVQVSGDLSIGHVGYKYNNSTGTLNGHIVSDDYGAVPEPATLGLMLIGLVGVGVARRRRLA